MTEIKLKLDGLDSLLKALKKPPTIRIGILNASKRTDGVDNATVGAAHEFGTSTIPMRSFLRMPLAEHLKPDLEAAGLFDKEAIAKVLKEKNFNLLAQKIAIVAEGVVAKAFDSSGFGQWQALNPKTMERKKVKQILVETQQLRNSISSEVVTSG